MGSLFSTFDKRLQLSLFSLRLGIFIVMFVWALDKFVNPAHSAGIFETFYGIGGVSHALVYLMGGLQCILMLLFLAGAFKTWTYGTVLVLHGASTFSSYAQYLDAFNNLLFFAAWPMLAACLALFLLREADTLFSVSKA